MLDTWFYFLVFNVIKDQMNFALTKIMKLGSVVYFQYVFVVVAVSNSLFKTKNEEVAIFNVWLCSSLLWEKKENFTIFKSFPAWRKTYLNSNSFSYIQSAFKF